MRPTSKTPGNTTLASRQQTFYSGWTTPTLERTSVSESAGKHCGPRSPSLLMVLILMRRAKIESDGVGLVRVVDSTTLCHLSRPRSRRNHFAEFPFSVPGSSGGATSTGYIRLGTRIMRRASSGLRNIHERAAFVSYSDACFLSCFRRSFRLATARIRHTKTMIT